LIIKLLLTESWLGFQETCGDGKRLFDLRPCCASIHSSIIL